MRAATDCIHHAKECRRLAKFAVKQEDFKHFVEMAETWELLARHRKADEQIADKQMADEQIADEQIPDEQLADILALADAIANRRNKQLPNSIVTRYGRRRRKRKLSDYQRAEAIKRRAAGETLSQIAKSYGVDISTILRSLI